MASGVLISFISIAFLCLSSAADVSIKKSNLILLLLAAIVILLQSAYFAIFHDNLKPIYSIAAIILVIVSATFLHKKL